MMDPKDRELAIEAAAAAWRPDAGKELPVHPAWYDLDDDGRERVFEVTHELRAMEAAMDPQGWSSTVHMVLERIRSSGSRR